MQGRSWFTTFFDNIMFINFLVCHFEQKCCTCHFQKAILRQQVDTNKPQELQNWHQSNFASWINQAGCSFWTKMVFPFFLHKGCPQTHEARSCIIILLVSERLIISFERSAFRVDDAHWKKTRETISYSWRSCYCGIILHVEVRNHFYSDGRHHYAFPILHHWRCSSAENHSGGLLCFNDSRTFFTSKLFFFPASPKFSLCF